MKNHYNSTTHPRSPPTSTSGPLGVRGPPCERLCKIIRKKIYISIRKMLAHLPGPTCIIYMALYTQQYYIYIYIHRGHYMYRNKGPVSTKFTFHYNIIV